MVPTVPTDMTTCPDLFGIVWHADAPCKRTPLNLRAKSCQHPCWMPLLSLCAQIALTTTQPFCRFVHIAKQPVILQDRFVAAHTIAICPHLIVQPELLTVLSESLRDVGLLVGQVVLGSPVCLAQCHLVVLPGFKAQLAVLDCLACCTG